MSVEVITAPAAYPVTLATAKLWCRIPSVDTTQDVALNMLIAAATKYAEHLTGRAFVERTLELSLPCFHHEICLPYAPLLGVDAIYYTDVNEATQTFAASNYEVNTKSEPGKVRALLNTAWPSLGTTFNPVRIRYRAGYRPPGSPVDLTDTSYLPPELLEWMYARIATIYHNRSHLIATSGPMALGEIPRDFADGMLDSLVLGTRLF